MNKESIIKLSKGKVLVIGELLADIISDENIPSLSSPATYQIYLGGSAANLCSNLKWLGTETELVSCVGEDSLGEFLIKEIQSAGLSTKYVSQTAHHQTSVILVGKSIATPDFIPYRSAEIHLKPIEDHLIADAALLHTTAFALSKEPARSVILNAFKKANKLGKTISVDWNFASNIWNEDNGVDVFKEICTYHPLLKLSLDDVQRFMTETLTVKEAMQYLDQFTTHITCLTCGKDGVWFKRANGPWLHRSAIPITNIASVTGAGDAFWSGFLHHYLNKHSIENCIIYALMVAKTKIEVYEPLHKIDHSLYIKD